jgi:hypothetical protein
VKRTSPGNNGNGKKSRGNIREKAGREKIEVINRDRKGNQD